VVADLVAVLVHINLVQKVQTQLHLVKQLLAVGMEMPMRVQDTTLITVMVVLGVLVVELDLQTVILPLLGRAALELQDKVTLEGQVMSQHKQTTHAVAVAEQVR
jgi:hypothetical protein